MIWQNTRLWQELSGRDTETASRCRLVLGWLLPDTEIVLRSSGTSPQDFTLHDDLHSFRVAERMVDVVPSDVLSRLGDYELVLLLLAAYVHDIGMTPTAGKLATHREYLIHGFSSRLGPDEVTRFQAWLDVSQSTLLGSWSDRSDSIDWSLAAYCRERHSDWSTEWIKSNLSELDRKLFTSAVADLVALCQSHTEDFERLASDRFDPRLVGSPAQVVHLRYLAMVLRLADVLEFDPKRTPEVIAQHRLIRSSSLTYWHKDHEIAFAIQSSGNVILSARPTSASVHRAIVATADQVEYELNLCRRIAETIALANGPGLEGLPHRWDLQNYIYRDIKPRDAAYEYIDGTFRPNIRRVLKLLTGTQLYIDPLAAVRELLQNAFDAVRASIAQEWLSQPDKADPEIESRLAQVHHVRIDLREDGGEMWLSCTDSGIGMSRSILENHFLVSASAGAPEIAHLARACSDASVPFRRSGQFGIGSLSYFMIADEVQITTRSQFGDGDGWTFKIEGLEGFGELKRHAAHLKGTKIVLKLKRDQFPNVVAWDTAINGYVTKHLRRPPCKLIVSSTVKGDRVIDAGWVPRQPDVDVQSIKSFVISRSKTRLETSEPPLWLDDAEKASWRSEAEAIETYASSARVAQRFAAASAALPEGAGFVRVIVPYYALPGGGSVAYSLLGTEPSRERPWVARQGTVSFSLDGFTVAPPPEYSTPTNRTGRMCYDLEIDWTSDLAVPGVARQHIQLSAKGKLLAEAALDIGDSLAAQLVSELEPSRFAWLNAWLLPEPRPWPKSQLCWLIRRTQDLSEWGAIDCPAVFLMDPRVNPVGLRWDGREVTVLQTIDVYQPVMVLPHIWSPSRVVAAEQGNAVPTLLWESLPAQENLRTDQFKIPCVFPPEWRPIAFMDLPFSTSRQIAGLYGHPRLWNDENPLVRLASTIPVSSHPRESYDQGRRTVDVERLMNSGPAAAAWLLNNPPVRGRDQLPHNVPADFVKRLWRLVSEQCEGVEQTLLLMRGQWFSLSEQGGEVAHNLVHLEHPGSGWSLTRGTAP